MYDLPVHLLTRSSKKKSSADAAVHTCKAPPRHSVVKLDDAIYAASANLALCQCASGKSDFVDTLLLLWEACGTYCTQRTGLASQPRAAFDVRPLASVRALSEFCANNSSLNGAAKIRRCLPYVADGSASPRETALALFLGLPERYGGCNLGIPVMNCKVDASPKAFAIAGRNTFRCDLCWPEKRIDLEYQSDSEHQGEFQRIRDSRRANALASMGWTVIGVTNSEATSISALATIAEIVRKKLGKRKRRRVADFGDRQLLLCQKLRLIPRW